MAKMVVPETVVAHSPFLTIGQVAAELGTEPIHILRLIARGSLRGVRAGEDVFDWKITGTELQRFLEAGSPDFEAIEITPTEGWWGPQGRAVLNRRAGGFEAAIRGELGSYLVADWNDFKPSIKDSGQLVVRTDSGIESILKAKVPAFKQINGMTPIDEGPYAGKLWKTVAACCQMRKLAESYVGREIPANKRIKKSAMVCIYESPERYREVVAYCCKAIQEQSIGTSRNYGWQESVKRDERVSARWHWKNAGLNWQAVAKLAF